MLHGVLNTAIIMGVSLAGTILIGSMAAYAIEPVRVPRQETRPRRCSCWRRSSRRVTTQVATFKVVNSLGLFDTRGSAIVAVHRHGHRRPSTSSSSSWRRSRASSDEAATIDGANHWTIYWRIILPLLKPAIATVVIIKGIAIYNEFYIPFLYMPSGQPGCHLDVAVPLHGAFRRPVGSDLRRHVIVMLPTLRDLPVPCSAGSTAASPPEPSSDPSTRPARPVRRMDDPCHSGWTVRAGRPARPSRTDSAIGRPGDRPRLRAHRPAGRRADPRPVPRTATRPLQAWIGATDWRYTHRPSAPTRRRTSASTWSSPGSTRSPTVALDGTPRRPDRQHAPQLPLRRHRLLVAAATTRSRWPFRIALALRRGRCATSSATGPTPYHQPVQRDPQDGLQLRLGLGAGTRHRRHLAAGRGCSAGARPARARSARSSPWTPTAPAASTLHVEVERADRDAALTVPVRVTARGADGAGADASVTVAPARRPPCSVEVRRRRALVAARLRRPAAVRPRSCGSRPPTAADPRHAGRAGSGSARSTLDTDAGRRRRAVHPRRQRRAGLRQGRQLDPRRRLPAPGRPATATPRGSTQAADAGINLLRVWGGGIYESRRLLRRLPTSAASWSGRTSCSPVPPTPRRRRCATRSWPRPARRSTRLAPHPSLVLWNGNNENIWGYEDWGWQGALDGRTWGPATTSSCCPAIVAELDPTRPYCPGSPYSSDRSSTRTTRATAPCTSGTCGTSATTRTTAATGRGSSPSSASRGRPPGRRSPTLDARRPARPDIAGHARAPEGRGRQPQARAAACADHLGVPRRLRRLALA